MALILSFSQREKGHKERLFSYRSPMPHVPCPMPRCAGDTPKEWECRPVYGRRPSGASLQRQLRSILIPIAGCGGSPNAIHAPVRGVSGKPPGTPLRAGGQGKDLGLMPTGSRQVGAPTRHWAAVGSMCAVPMRHRDMTLPFDTPRFLAAIGVLLDASVESAVETRFRSCASHVILVT